MTIYIGVDPGTTGAIAMLNPNGGIYLIWDLQFIDGVMQPTFKKLFDLLRLKVQHVRVYIEKQQPFPNTAAKSNFQAGRGYGALEGAFIAQDIELNYVLPRVWKKTLGLSPNKEQSREMANELWPDAGLFNRKMDHNRAEACLVAHYGRNHG